MPRQMTRSITVTWNQLGYHCWPEAGDMLPDRAYLASKHRHQFHYEVTIPVEHNDREIEFHDLLDFCRYVAPEEGADLGRMSCEDMAVKVGEAVLIRHPGRSVTVTVWEDKEVGATVGWSAE